MYGILSNATWQWNIVKYSNGFSKQTGVEAILKART